MRGGPGTLLVNGLLVGVAVRGTANIGHCIFMWLCRGMLLAAKWRERL
jgi:hypothetical protein